MALPIGYDGGGIYWCPDCAAHCIAPAELATYTRVAPTDPRANSRCYGCAQRLTNAARRIARAEPIRGGIVRFVRGGIRYTAEIGTECEDSRYRFVVEAVTRDDDGSDAPADVQRETRDEWHGWRDAGDDDSHAVCFAGQTDARDGDPTEAARFER